MPFGLTHPKSRLGIPNNPRFQSNIAYDKLKTPPNQTKMELALYGPDTLLGRIVL